MLYTTLSKLPKLEKATIPLIPDTPDQQQFRSLVSLTVSGQDSVRGKALNASNLQHLSLSFSGKNVSRNGSHIFNLASLSSLLSLEITDFWPINDKESPYEGSSCSITSVIIRSSTYRPQLFEGICGSVRELTLDQGYWSFPRVPTLAFPKLTKLTITGEPSNSCVSHVPAFLSTINRENLRELHLHFNDEGYVASMPSRLLNLLTQFNQLRTFSLLGTVSFTASGWNSFAAFNHLLQCVTLTIGDIHSSDQSLTVSFVPRLC
jgi:hypothetical protein